MNKIYEINSKIYKNSFIKQAIIDFKDVTDIQSKWWKLTIFWEDEIEIEEIFNEFMNYVIWFVND